MKNKFKEVLTPGKKDAIMSDQQTQQIPMSFIIDIEISLTEVEFKAFKQLGGELGESLPDLYRRCANEKCAEYLDTYKNNKEPKSEVQSRNNDTAA